MRQKTFQEIGNLIENIPSIVIGNFVKAGTLTFAKKYPDDPYEIDWDRMEKLIVTFLLDWAKTHDQRIIIHKLRKNKKIDGSIWRNIDQDLLTQITPEMIDKILAQNPKKKKRFKKNVAEAAREIIKTYNSKKEGKNAFSSLRAASDRFYDSHVFTNVTTTKKALYASVRKQVTKM